MSIQVASQIAMPFNSYEYAIDPTVYSPQQPFIYKQNTIEKAQHLFKQKLASHNELPCAFQSLNWVFTVITQEENSQIKNALKKKDGYAKRFFSTETWDEWVEDKTALGKVVSQFLNYIEGTTKVKRFIEMLDTKILLEADQEASLLQKSINQNSDPQGFGFIDRVTNGLKAIDKTISSFLSFPQGVSAEVDLNKIYAAVFYQNLATQKDLSLLEQLDKMNGAAAIFNENLKSQLLADNALIGSIIEDQLQDRQDTLRSEYDNDYNKAIGEFEEIRRKHHIPKTNGQKGENSEFSLFISSKTPPDYQWIWHATQMDDHQERCVLTGFATPGTFHWQITRKSDDTIVAKGGLKYSDSTPIVKPCVPKQSNLEV